MFIERKPTIRLWAAVVALAVLLTAQPSLAEKRIALVIGNSDYTFAPLSNPKNDAKLMARTLRGLNFDVIETINASQKQMKKAVRKFGRKLDGAGKDGVGLFFYAGHGVQVKGANYLIPVDAEIETEGDVDIEAINAQSILSMMEFSGVRLSFVIMDACRNNPYKRSFRSSTRGLAKMEAPTGSLIAYATAPGDVAADGKGKNSPYTAALTKMMNRPGLSVERMFREVRNIVREKTKNAQTPWESSSLTGGDFYFNDGGTTLQAPTAAAPATQPAPAVDKEAMFWQSIQGSEDADDFQAYLDQYPNGSFAALAKVKVKKLAKTLATSSPQVAALPPAGAGEENDTGGSADPLIRGIIADADSAIKAVTNDFNHGNGLAEIAKIQARVGEIEESRRNIEASLRIAAAGKDWQRNFIYANAAVAQAYARDIKSALDTASKIPDKIKMVEAIAGIAKAQSEAGDNSGARQNINEAQRIANGIEKNQYLALIYISDAWAAAGEIETALRIAQRIADDKGNTYGLFFVAIKQANDGDIKGARQSLNAAIRAADTDKNPFGRVLGLVGVARTLMKIGDLETARRITTEVFATASSFEDKSKSSKRNIALSHIAGIQTIAFDSDLGLRTANSISSSLWRYAGLSSVAWSQAVTGDVTGGRKMANAIPDNHFRGQALRIIAERLFDKKRVARQARKGN